MKTVIVTNNCLKFYSGSELITLDICDYFVKKGWNVYLCAMDIGSPLSKHINPKVKQINLKKQPIPIKQVDLIVGHHKNVIEKVLQTVKCNTVIQNSLSVYGGIEDYSSKATKLLANSQETKTIKQTKINKPIDVFVNSCNQEYFQQVKILKKDIKYIAIITNHSWYNGISRPNLHIIGGRKSAFVNAKLLLQYDVVITIGRTVQQCLCLGVPVYCYDHFGGPGYITLENIDFNESLNFSGRQKAGNTIEKKDHNFAKIFADIYGNYDKVCKQQAELVKIARQRYNFNNNMDKVLKEIINE